MASRAALRRSLLFVPGSSKRFLGKSSTFTADCIVYDLEDSVSPANKKDARSLVRETLDTAMPNIRERAVRINSVGSGLALPDLQALVESPSFTTIVLPKCDTPGDLTFVRDVLAHLRPKSLPPVSVIALIESAQSLMNLNEICRSAPGLLSGLAFAAEDFMLDLNITRTPAMSELLFARSSIVTAARAHRLPSTLDLVATAYKSEEDQRQLISESEDGRRMGFNGKQCIHPSQVDTVNKAFTPSQKEIEWAVRILIAQKKAEQQGKGAWALDGKMIDLPVEERARNLVKLADLCGLDVETLRVKYASQEPE